MKNCSDFKTALAELIAKHSKDHLAEVDGMVTQVWADGEVTSTKSGSLLGQRTLHSISQGFINTSTWNDENVEVKGLDGEWPHWKQIGDKAKVGFIYTDSLGVAAMAELLVKYAIYDNIRRMQIAGMQMLPYDVKFIDKEGNKVSDFAISTKWVNEQLEEALK